MRRELSTNYDVAAGIQVGLKKMLTVGYETCTVVDVRERRQARIVDHKKSEGLAPRKREEDWGRDDGDD